MQEVKIVWRYNPADGNKMVGSKVVDPDYKLSDGETFTAPGDGLFEPLRFDLATQVWIGVSKEEWEAAHPTPTPTPTAQQTLMAGMLKDLANVKNDGKSQDKLNANVMKQMAQLSIANASKDKLSAQLLKDVAGLKIRLDNLENQVTQVEAQATNPTQSAQSSAATDPVQVTEAAEPTQSTAEQPSQPKED